MAEPLKTFFDSALISSLAEDLRRAGLPTERFVEEASQGLAPLALTARAEQIGRALRRCLPERGDDALRALLLTLGPPHAATDWLGLGMAPFRYLPHSTVIAELGPSAPEAGLDACHALTQRFTAEFCLRPIVLAHPERTWARLEGWVTDPSPHVRRLVSEGLRPRLPWAPRLPPVQEDPRRALRLLASLVDDDAPMVRRSVANFLGDVAKDHPDLAVETARAWLQGARPGREALARHGLRHLIKAGHRGALDLLGHPPAQVELVDFRAPARVALGQTLTCTFRVIASAPSPQALVVDLVLTFPGASGRSRTKVFKLGRADLDPGASQAFAWSLPLRDLSTRTYRPGPYTLTPQINGERQRGQSVEVA